MNAPISWVECPAWELDFFALPHRIPWPSDVPPEDVNKQPFDAGNLLRAIEILEEQDAAAAAPWTGFLNAAEHIQDLNEALQDSVERDIDGVPVRVFTAEHLAAIAFDLGRPKDRRRLDQFREEKALDAHRLSQILERHGLLERWLATRGN